MVMEDLPASRSDQISIARNPEWPRLAETGYSQTREGSNIPHPPSPQMVIEILSMANGHWRCTELGGNVDRGLLI
jgi:hypothetical protein